MAMSAIFLKSRSFLFGTLFLTLSLSSYAQRVTATVGVGNSPAAVAVNPVTNRIYVANTAGNSVTIIDGSNNSTTTVNVGTGPQAIAVNPVTNEIYVANTGSNNVTVINGADNTTATVNVGSGPQGIAVNSATNKIYVANTGSNNVTVIDATDNLNITTPVGAGTGPVSVAVNMVTNKVYVSNHGSNNVTVINGVDNTTSSVTDPIGKGPSAVAVNPVSNRIYVANQTSNSVTVINGAGNTVATTVGAGQVPVAITVDVISNMIYIASATSNNVTVIDENNFSATSQLADINATHPQAIGVNPVTNKIYVANQTSNNVTTIDGASNSIISQVSVASPLYWDVNPATNKIYVAQGGAVTIIDGVTNATTTIAVPNGGSGSPRIAVNPITNKIYVADCQGSCTGTNDVAVIDGVNNTITAIHNLFTGNGPSAIAINPVSNKIYVSFVDRGLLRGPSYTEVIDGASNTVSLLCFCPANDIAVNPATNTVYLAGNNSIFGRGGVMVVDGASDAILKTLEPGTPIGVIDVNPVTNKIYAPSDKLLVIDGTTNSISARLAVTGAGVAVNPTSNRIYVSDLTNGLIVIDGATNTVVTTIPGAAVGKGAINQVTNKIYANLDSNNVAILDGITNSTTALNGITNAGAPAVNLVTNRSYISRFFNNSNDNVTVLTEQQVTTIPLTTTIIPFPNNQTGPATTVFFTTNSTYTPNVPPVQNVFYQLDTWQGPWLQATGSAPSFRADLPILSQGPHILYAYASDAQQGDSTQTGNGTSGESIPIIGQITAYFFAVLPFSSGSASALNVSANPTAFNQPVTFTDTLASINATNTVAFYDNYPAGTLLSTVTVHSGKASLSTAGLSVGVHQITAVYSGDAMLPPAVSNTVYQVVNKASAPTALALTAGSNPSVGGSSLTFTATLSPQFGGTPTGTVTFMDGNTTLGTATPAGAGTWTFTTSALTAGVHPITAVYSGDSNFAGNTSPVFSEAVESNAGGASTAALTVNGSVGPVTVNFGVALGALPAQNATFVVTVTGSTDGDSVVLLDGNRQLGATLTLASGQASYATQLPAGQHNVQAVYIGNGGTGGSSSLVVIIDRSPRPRPR